MNEYKFPIAFNNTDQPMIVANVVHAVSENKNFTLMVKSRTKTGFTAYATYGGGMADETFMCIAIGY